MELKKIPNEKGKDFKDILEIYMYSFPADERRELGSLVKNFGNPPYCFYSVYDKGLLI